MMLTDPAYYNTDADTQSPCLISHKLTCRERALQDWLSISPLSEIAHRNSPVQNFNYDTDLLLSEVIMALSYQKQCWRSARPQPSRKVKLVTRSTPIELTGIVSDAIRYLLVIRFGSLQDLRAASNPCTRVNLGFVCAIMSV